MQEMQEAQFQSAGNGTPLQYSCLENSIDRGAWWATVHGDAKSWTQLSNETTVLCHRTCLALKSFVNKMFFRKTAAVHIGSNRP